MRIMLFRMDPESGTGLADQLAGQVRGALITGLLQPGARLPPAREVATGLAINMHTVLRAYSQLRDDGLIELRRGRGARVRTDVDVRTVGLDRQIRDLLDAAGRLGLDPEQVVEQIRRVTS